MYPGGYQTYYDHRRHKVTAAAIAKRIGILKDESEACEGAVIENMTDEELQNFVEGISRLCPRFTGA